MGHYSAIVFTTQHISDKMESFNFEHGYNNVFEEQYTIKEAKKEFKDFMSNLENFVDDLDKYVKYKTEGYKTFFIEEYGSEIDENGKVGYYVNPKGIYDWFQVGGRWSNCLPLKDGTMVDDAPIDLVDIDKIEGDTFYCSISVNDEYEEIIDKEHIKELFEQAKEWQKINGEQVQVYIVDYHS